MTATPAPRLLYLNDDGEQIFSIFHQAAADGRRATAVLMCPPFGWEDVCSYRSRREWAARLAHSGFPTLRIELPGTGDSAGSPTDRQRLSAWTSCVVAAARWLSDECEHESVAAIGIGLGGMLICAAVCEDAPVHEAVLWAVPARGEALVREQRAFERLEAAKFATRRHAQPQEGSGSVRAGGFTLSAETAGGLEQLDLASATFPEGRPRRVLLLGRDGIAVDGRLRACLERAGTVVRCAPGSGFGAMMAEPQQSRPPTDVFALVEDWLEVGAQSAATAPRPPAASHIARPPVRTSAAAEFDSAGTPVRETPVFIEQPFGRLFAVLSEPGGQAATHAASSGVPELGALLLNAGAIRRIGPSRMWVEIARRWAAEGIPTLRLDLEGLGDADGDASRFADVAELYVPQFVAQVRAAIDFLEARTTARKFVLAGLCSGAYWSFHAALQDERVDAAFMLNPRLLFWDPVADNMRELRRRLLNPPSWRVVARGDVALARVGQVALHAPRSLLANAIARWQARGAIDQLDLALDGLSAAGKQLAFMFSDNEPLHDELERQGRLERSGRWPNLQLERLPGADHTLRPVQAQRGAHDALDRALHRELQRART
jgi:pimeloyl-ACP methyl ester carboxylesterase